MTDHDPYDWYPDNPRTGNRGKRTLCNRAKGDLSLAVRTPLGDDLRAWLEAMGLDTGKARDAPGWFVVEGDLPALNPPPA